MILNIKFLQKNINEEKKYRELKESIRMMNSQGSDTENWKKVKKLVLMKLLSVVKSLIIF